MTIYPNKLTKLCISISKNPGTSGSKFHNTGYKLLNLNYLYLPLKFDNLIKLGSFQINLILKAAQYLCLSKKK